MDIARIDKASGVVVNIECATQEWVDAHADDPDYTFVPYTPEQPAIVGLKHDPVAGFEQIATDSVTLDADTMAALALTAKQRAVIAAAQPTPEGG